MRGSLLICANMWLLAALTLFVGGKVVRYQPTKYAFFEVGVWLDPSTYFTLIGLCLGAAFLCFVLLLRPQRFPSHDQMS